MNPRDTPGFEALAAVWDAKLAASGLRDIEPAGKKLFLRDHHIETMKKQQLGWRTGGWIYFEVYQRWVLSRTWPSRMARLMAACAAEGVGASEIPALLPKSPAPAVVANLMRGWREECLAWHRSQP